MESSDYKDSALDGTQHSKLSRQSFYNSSLLTQMSTPTCTNAEVLKLIENSGYLEYIQDTWQKGKKALESGMSYDPTIWVNFFLLIHNGDHFRYTNEKALEVATHTTLFTSFHSDTASVPLAIDFVKYKDLEAALKKIEASFDVLYKHLGLYLKPSPRPAERN